MNQNRKKKLISEDSRNVTYYYQLPKIIVKIWGKTIKISNIYFVDQKTKFKNLEV